MRNPHIYIDLDDVLNRFTLEVFRTLGLKSDNYQDLAERVGPTSAVFDFVAQAQAVWPERNYTYDSFWLSIPRDLWASIPKSDECDWLLEKCATLVGKQSVTVLTAPVRGPAEAQCRAGKYDWRDKFLPAWAQDNFCIRGNKGLFANDAALLIDDGEHNVKGFRDNGGAAMLWPRPWNNAPQLVLDDISTRLERWCDHAYAKCAELYVA